MGSELRRARGKTMNNVPTPLESLNYTVDF